MITRDELKGHWDEISGRIKKRWNQLTDDDLRGVAGNTEELIGVIQRTTGEELEQITAFLSSLATNSVEAGRKGAEQVVNMAHQVAETTQRYAQGTRTFVEEGCQNVGQQMREGKQQAEELVRKRPIESVAVGFGLGMVAGVLVALAFRSR